MNYDLTAVTNEQVYKAKLERRKRMAVLPMSVKLRALLELQHLGFNMSLKKGRKPNRPWDMPVETYEKLTARFSNTDSIES